MMPTVTLTMIVRNEAVHLGKCLASVKDAVDEIVIVDTGSGDETKIIAGRYTDKIFDYRWDGDFSAARNLAISYSRGQWIFVLDADECLDETQGSLRETLAVNFLSVAIFFPLICLKCYVA